MRGLGFILCLFSLFGCISCKSRGSATDGPRDVRKLVILTANNDSIVKEFTWAFQQYCAQELAQRVEIERRDVGGGSSSIESFIFDTYNNIDRDKLPMPEDYSCDIDIVWGGGDAMYDRLAASSPRNPDGLLEKLDLPPEVLCQIGSPGDDAPNLFGGLPFYHKDLRWVGSTVSSFGFLCNSGMMARCGLRVPSLWEDVADARYTDLVTLADPSQSGSVLRSYHLIVQSAPTWAQGWEMLLKVLSNAKRFSDSAGAAANAPVLGDCLVASCIDFYGLMRVAEAPDQLRYVNPEGQTTYGSDPIGILKNPPHRELAQQFVQFVMSARGQALWVLPPGVKDGPIRAALGRLPIRRDVFALYKDNIPPGVNFYASKQLMKVAPEVARVDTNVLKFLVTSAAVENVDSMRRARKRLNQLAGDSARPDAYRRCLAEFNRLPDDVDSIAKMQAVSPILKDELGRYTTTRAWRDFFRAKFDRIAGEP